MENAGCGSNPAVLVLRITFWNLTGDGKTRIGAARENQKASNPTDTNKNNKMPTANEGQVGALSKYEEA